MKSIIASLFTIYAITNGQNRLLQQAPSVPQFPGQGGGAPPANGGGAAQPPPATPATPGTPTTPSLPAAVPETTRGWIPVTLPPMNSAQMSTVMECVLDNTNPAGCAGRMTTLENASQNFKLTCSNIGACAASTLTFAYANSFVERVEQISFSEQYAGYGATVIMDSSKSLRKQYIDKFECKAPGACLNTGVKLFGGASVNDVDCPRPEYCSNCNIYECMGERVTPENPNAVELCGTPKPCFNY